MSSCRTRIFRAALFFLGKKDLPFGWVFFFFFLNIQPLEVTDFFIITHYIRQLNSRAAHYPLGKKKSFQGDSFLFFPPPGCIRKSGIKSLSSPPWLLHCQSERSDGREARAMHGKARRLIPERRARCSILAAFPNWWQVSRSWNNKSWTVFNLRFSEVAAGSGRPVLCVNSEEFLLLKDLQCDHNSSFSSASSKCNRLIPLRARQRYFLEIV